MEVQPGGVPEGTTSEGGEPTQATPPLTEERVAQLLEEKLATEREQIRRGFQSEKDRAISEIQKRAEVRITQQEKTLNAMRGTLAELDPETANRVRLAEMEAKDQFYQGREVEEAQREQIAQFDAAFHDNMTQSITNLGVDPEDKKIDWAQDAPDYLSRQQRILVSVGKITKENMVKERESLLQEVKDLNLQNRKELGLDSTPPEGGSTGGPDADFLRDFGSGKLPASKENMERHKKIQQSY